MKPKYLIISMVTVVLLVVAVLSRQPDTFNTANMVNQQAMVVNKTLTTHNILQQEHIRKSPTMPVASIQQVASLQGSLPDGAVHIDKNGDVIADKDLHRLFDYYLSTTGEMTTGQIRSRLLLVASNFLSLDQLEQLRDFFDQYVNYLAASERFALSHFDDAELTERLFAISDLRSEILGPVMANAFFAEEEAYARHVLQMQGIEIAAVPEAQQLKWLAVEERATEFHDVLIESKVFNDLQLSEEQRMIVRTDRYGETVAFNLATLDAKQLAWQGKVNQYIHSRQQLAGNSDLLQGLEQNYDPKELKRLRAYYQAQANRHN